MKLQPIAALTRWAQSFNPYDSSTLKGDAGRADVSPAAIDESQSSKLAARIFIVFFLAFVGWAVFAPIDSGVTVQGTVVVMGNRKAVQHIGGGVVEEIMVKEGDKVTKGATLIKINPLNSRANLTAAELEYYAAYASEVRLLAERAGPASRLVWPGELRNSTDPRIVDVLAQQDQLFQSRQNEFREQQAIADQQIRGLETQLSGQQEMLLARKRQLALVAEEAANSAALAADGYVPRSRANELERSRVDLEISIASLLSEIGRNQTSLAGMRLQKMQQQSAHHKEIDSQLAEAKKAKLSQQARMESLRFDMAMTEIKAPVAGIVVGLKANTVGGVVPAGQTLMEILPVEGKLIAEVDIPPRMIDKVRQGLEADMRFTAFNVNTTPVVPGIVRLVGADRLPPAPPTHPDEYYLGQIEVTEKGLQILRDKAIQPGMPVEVVIKTGERSFMSYLLKPLSDRFAHSFKD